MSLGSSFIVSNRGVPAKLSPHCPHLHERPSRLEVRVRATAGPSSPLLSLDWSQRTPRVFGVKTLSYVAPSGLPSLRRAKPSRSGSSSPLFADGQTDARSRKRPDWRLPGLSWESGGCNGCSANHILGLLSKSYPGPSAFSLQAWCRGLLPSAL